LEVDISKVVIFGCRHRTPWAHLHPLDVLRDLPPALYVLPEQGGAAEVAAPHVVDGHRRLNLLHQFLQNMLVLKRENPF
jgi:hypothetical protein